MFKFVLFIAGLWSGTVGASCAEHIKANVSRPGITYPSGFQPPAAGSLEFFHLNGKMEADLRNGFPPQGRTMADLLKWLHAYSYTGFELTNMATQPGNDGLLKRLEAQSAYHSRIVADVIERLLKFDDGAFDANYEELVAVAANLSTTMAGQVAGVPLAERLGVISLARGDAPRRHLMIDWMARHYTLTPGRQDELREILPEWLDGLSTPERWVHCAWVINAQVAHGGALSHALIRAIVDGMPTSWDTRADRLNGQPRTMVKAALTNMHRYFSSVLSPAQQARLEFLVREFPE